ncbi:MAG: hypothetical protein A3C82_02630 [Candidatus Wildermuthbacteria bacterium RIFCSPHIGHO2_02_FULL_47_12]|uniref:HTH deoR-type domain-containing protein n=1 Tax=Candidatus Wildermuthbacteria bacterium RIFCSPHIGHO2_02_FULL_47_12 TaxID=1802451 RepID=A0A1G2R2Q4_9BACT|nr:MAG: hypothetical protein A3C82_02630 [Candidatus Wildermuthbacteria bacterium RIFCSPHIGHO2_02_FULL_47_12]
MNPDFFVKLTLGAYRVTDGLSPQEQEKGEIRSLANSVLAHLILFSETNPITQEQRKSLIPKIQGEIGSLVWHVVGLKNNSKIEKKYLLIIEKEYQKIVQWLQEQSLAIAQDASVNSDVSYVQKPKEENSLSERQKRILGILQNKEKTQVWELQKVLTEVTKRTLRRDLDELLSLNLIERKGEWNAVFYRLKQ